MSGTVISSAAVNSDLSDIASALTGSLPRDGQAGMIGALKAANGSSIAPSITFTNDSQTGFYSPATGEIGVVIEGTQIGIFSSTGLNIQIPTGVPVGLGGDYYGGTVPMFWYLCYGQAVSRTTYALLFAAIGTTYGSGDGATTFNLPDARGSILVGADNMGGVAAGRLTTAYFGSDPTILGDRGGLQNTTLITANLPPYTPAGSISNGGIFASTNAAALASINNNNGGGGGVFSATSTTASVSVSQSASTFNGAAASGQISTPFSTIQPSFIINKIIFAGA